MNPARVENVTSFARDDNTGLAFREKTLENELYLATILLFEIKHGQMFHTGGMVYRKDQAGQIHEHQKPFYTENDSHYSTEAMAALREASRSFHTIYNSIEGKFFPENAVPSEGPTNL